MWVTSSSLRKSCEFIPLSVFFLAQYYEQDFNSTLIGQSSYLRHDGNYQQLDSSYAGPSTAGCHTSRTDLVQQEGKAFHHWERAMLLSPNPRGAKP